MNMNGWKGRLNSRRLSGLLGVSALGLMLGLGAEDQLPPPPAPPLPAPVTAPAGGPETAPGGEQPASIEPAGMSVATFALATIADADLSEGGWSAADKDGDVAFRTAKGDAKGAMRTFKVPAWWAEKDLRPAEGSRYILELYFKDTLTQPAEFYSYGAAGSYFGMTKMHVFGGANDGKWKVAYIPISWDLVIRLKDELPKTQFGVKSAADVAISTANLRKAVPADEARYEAECRAWVAWSQKALREANPLKLTAPDFLLNQDKRRPALLAFSWTPLVPLLPNAAPKAAQIGAPIHIRMCLNEMEGGAFGVYANGKELTHVDYALSDLKNGDEVLKADLVRRTAEYALVRPAPGKYTWFPQRLWPAYPADVPAGQSQEFLFNLRTHRGESKAGLYKGTVTITSDQGQGVLPVEVEVLPIDLMTMEEAGLTMGGCCVGLPQQQDVEFQTAYNQNCINLWFAGVQPPMTHAKQAGKLNIDFTYMDEWMINAKKHGLQAIVWFLGGDPYGYPDTVTLVRDLNRIDLQGEANMNARLAWMKKQDLTPDKLLPENRLLYKDWVKQIYDRSVAQKWPEVILTPFDEPAKWTQTERPEQLKGKLAGVIGTGTWIKGFFKDCCAAIHEAAPKIRIYASIHHNRQDRGKDGNEGIVFLDDVDVFCTNAIHEDPQLGDKVRAGGPKKTFWQYSGCGSGGTGAPDQARYTFGFYFAAFDSRGSLSWAYNWGPGFDTATDPGDNWQYAYLTPYGTVPAPFFEGMREAWDDRRIIETFKKKFSRNQAEMAKLDTILKAAAGSRAGGGRDTVNDFWAAIDDDAKLDAWRDTLLNELKK